MEQMYKEYIFKKDSKYILKQNIKLNTNERGKNR